MPIAVLCLTLDIIYLVVGSISFSLTGYSGGTEVFVWSLVVLVIAIALYLYRVLVEDKSKLRWSLDAPATADEQARRSRGAPDRPAGRRAPPACQDAITWPLPRSRSRATAVRRASSTTARRTPASAAARGRRRRSRPPTTRRSARSTVATGCSAGRRSAASGILCLAVGFTNHVSLLFLIPAGLMTWFMLLPAGGAAPPLARDQRADATLDAARGVIVATRTTRP